jgi:tRNA(fMet)-specific endonuclease VapC
MAARFLLDTNICIYIRRRRPPAVLERFRQLKPGEAVLSVITYGELVYGVEKSQFREHARRQLTELAGLLPVMELPMRAGEFYGSIRAALAAEGDMIGNNDLWRIPLIRPRSTKNQRIVKHSRSSTAASALLASPRKSPQGTRQRAEGPRGDPRVFTSSAPACPPPHSKRRPITLAAMSGDILACTLERCGVKGEILGFRLAPNLSHGFRTALRRIAADPSETQAASGCCV